MNDRKNTNKNRKYAKQIMMRSHINFRIAPIGIKPSSVG